MIAISAHRVSKHTSPRVNQRIRRTTERSIAYYARNPRLIPDRLRELDREWDIERVLETGSSSLTLTGLLLSITSGRKWLLLPLAVQGFFLQHAFQGWCPPLTLLRELGVRTADEINRERYALKNLPSDFRDAAATDANAGDFGQIANSTIP